jgi:hypothetical protein
MLSSQSSRSEEQQPSTSKFSSTTLILDDVKNKLFKVQDAIEQINEVTVKSKSLQSLKPTPLDIDDLVSLDRAHQHLLWVNAIGKVLDKSKMCKKDHEALISCHRILVSIVSELINSSCLNLRTYSLTSLVYLRSITMPALEKELEEDLAALNYPKCVLGLDDEMPPNQDFAKVKKFQKTYSVLNEIRLPETILKQYELANTDPALVVLRPLKKRFKFHFCGSKKTNNPVKPEWYMQQVGGWLKHSRRFFEAVIRPIDDHPSASDSFQRFSSGLCSQVLKKLQNDIIEIMYDDVTLSHMIDEVLTFSQEFANLFIAEEYLPLVVLLDPTIFNRWLTLERKFAFAKIDDMMLEDSSWTASNTRQDVSKCTETFVVLLQSITNRFKHLNVVETQLKFVQLQCDLLEDMRLRLAQILRQEQSFPLSEKYCLILNSSQYLIEVMNNWSGIPLYLQLELAKFGAEEHSASVGLFKEVIDGFDFLVHDLVKNLSDHMYYEVKSRSKMYKDIKWFSFVNDQPDPCSESLPMFQILASQVDFIGKQLSSKLAGQVVTLLCEHLSGFYIHDIILLNQFNGSGCQQIQADVDKGMNAIFAQYIMDPSKLEASHQLKEACKLLCMKSGNAILLLDSLIDPKTAINSKDILRDMGLVSLDGQQAIKVLKRRVDLK